MSSDEITTRTRILAATLQLMEQGQGQDVRMQDIAKAANISRQAVYLHFASRAELLVATTHYVDEIRDIDARSHRWETATSGQQQLAEWIAFWGNYLPEIYAVAKALLAVRDKDEAAAIAWNDRMAAVRNGCHITIAALDRDGLLAPEWDVDRAVDLLSTLSSVRNWEQLTIECGWSTDEYIDRMQKLARRTFMRGG